VINILDSNSKYIFVRSKGALLLKTYFGLGMSYDFNSNFGEILNMARERISESSKHTLKLGYVLLDDLYKIVHG
jgi:hypothetical protein